MAELTRRILVALFGIPILMTATFLGDWFFFSVIVIISSVSQWEFYKIQTKKEIFPQSITGVIVGLAILLCINTREWVIIDSILIMALMFILANEMFRRYKNISANIGVTLLGILYIPLFLGTLVYIRSYVDQIWAGTPFAGFKFVMAIFISIWICDTFAYGFGKRFGRRKLYEKVSPNKTLLGGIAGIIGSILVFSIITFSDVLPLTWWQALIFGIVIGIVGQTGDLVESWFKRDAGVKDTSNLLPGHGGMLDRFDSIIFVSPAVFILISILF